MIARMPNPIHDAFVPLMGLPCWGVDRVHGSILSFEFGAPRLVIREPHASMSSSAKVRRLLAKRRVRPVGEWNLTISACHWHVTVVEGTLAADDDSHDKIEAALSELDGQKLTLLTLDLGVRKTTFSFDLGATLATWPYEADVDEQWSLYMPDRRVLTYRADGSYSAAPADAEPDQEVWQFVTHDVVPLSQ